MYVATAFIQIICISCHSQSDDTLRDIKLRLICFGTKTVKDYINRHIKLKVLQAAV